MADRDSDYYNNLFRTLVDVADGNPEYEDELNKLIEFLGRIGDKTEDDEDGGELEDDYETMDPEDFLRKALGEDTGGSEDDDDEGEDDNPWRHNVDEEYNDAGGEGIDSVGDSEDESEERKKPNALEVSDEGEKEKKPGKDEACTVSDKGMKKVRKRGMPSEEDLTRRNIAAALKDLRF